MSTRALGSSFAAASAARVRTALGSFARRLRDAATARAAALADRVARTPFEVRVWNAVNPKDPQQLLLYVGETQSLKQSLLGLSGSAYLEIDRSQGLEVYARSGLRVSDLRPPALFVLGIRQATLHAGRRRRETVRLAARVLAAAIGAALLVVVVTWRSGPPRTLAATRPAERPAAGDSIAGVFATLAARCPAARPCELGAVLADGSLSAAAAGRIGAGEGIVVAGFAPGRSGVPERFLPVLGHFFRMEGGGTGACRGVILVGRASRGGDRARNLELAASRARAVAARLAAAARDGEGRGEHAAAVLLAWGDEALPLDLGRVRVTLARAGIATAGDPAEFERFAYQSVQVLSAGCP